MGDRRAMESAELAVSYGVFVGNGAEFGESGLRKASNSTDLVELVGFLSAEASVIHIYKNHAKPHFFLDGGSWSGRI